jgi:NAD(P)H-flavin reductase
VTQRLEKKNFTLIVRLGNALPKPHRWDKSFIREELVPFKGKIDRVYVCGAPQMNETFDRAFEELVGELELDWAKIEIL